MINNNIPCKYIQLLVQAMSNLAGCCATETHHDCNCLASMSLPWSASQLLVWQGLPLSGGRVSRDHPWKTMGDLEVSKVLGVPQGINICIIHFHKMLQYKPSIFEVLPWIYGNMWNQQPEIEGCSSSAVLSLCGTQSTGGFWMAHVSQVLSQPKHLHGRFLQWGIPKTIGFNIPNCLMLDELWVLVPPFWDTSTYKVKTWPFSLILCWLPTNDASVPQKAIPLSFCCLEKVSTFDPLHARSELLQGARSEPTWTNGIPMEFTSVCFWFVPRCGRVLNTLLEIKTSWED